MYQHSEELVAMAPVMEQGRIYPIPTHDNRRCAFLLEDGASEMYTQLQLDGKVLAETDGMICAVWSPDGKKLATTHTFHEGGEEGEWWNELRINGEPYLHQESEERRYRHHLAWLEKDQLAWNEDGKEGEENGFFVEGKNVTGKFTFKQVTLERDVTALFVELPEEGMRYTVFEDGTRSEKEQIQTSTESVKPSEDEPEYCIDEKTGKQFLRFRGKDGPVFDEVLKRYFKTKDGARIAYIGFKSHPVIAFLVRKTFQLADRLFDKEEEQGRGAEDPPLLLKGIALLMNPYFGPGYLINRLTQRFYPVVNHRRWKKGYPQVELGDCFFTPNGCFVVKAQTQHGQQLVIDEDEGPPFDRILNIRYLEAEQCLSYLGQRGTSYFRVTVSSLLL